MGNEFDESRIIQCGEVVEDKARKLNCGWNVADSGSWDRKFGAHCTGTQQIKVTF